MIFIRKSKESPTLANHLTHIIREYQTYRNKLPKLIRLPIWRKHELEDCVNAMTFMPMAGGHNAFNGIPFIYVVGRDWIELE